MMETTALGLTALSTTLSLLALWALFHWLYRDYRVDLFRQRMFTLRDQLFDIAASGRIAFDDPAYGKLRSMINGYIRFAHRINLPLLLFASRSRHALSQGVDQITQLTTAVRAQPAETARDLDRIISQTHWYVAEQLILTSLVMWLTSASDCEALPTGTDVTLSTTPSANLSGTTATRTHSEQFTVSTMLSAGSVETA